MFRCDDIFFHDTAKTTPSFPIDSCYLSGAPCQITVRQLSDACQMSYQTSVNSHQTSVSQVPHIHQTCTICPPDMSCSICTPDVHQTSTGYLSDIWYMSGVYVVHVRQMSGGSWQMSDGASCRHLTTIWQGAPDKWQLSGGNGGVELVTHFLYGLHAAINLSPFAACSGAPDIVRSHRTSLMSPMASVVLASSKNKIVCIPGTSLWFLSASLCALFIFLMISSLEVPPWTYEKLKADQLHLRVFYRHTAEVHGLVMVRSPCSILEGNCLALHPASQVPIIDRYTTDIWFRPLTLTSDLDIWPWLWPLTLCKANGDKVETPSVTVWPWHTIPD